MSYTTLSTFTGHYLYIRQFARQNVTTGAHNSACTDRKLVRATSLHCSNGENMLDSIDQGGYIDVGFRRELGPC